MSNEKTEVKLEPFVEKEFVKENIECKVITTEKVKDYTYYKAIINVTIDGVATEIFPTFTLNEKAETLKVNTRYIIRGFLKISKSSTGEGANKISYINYKIRYIENVVDYATKAIVWSKPVETSSQVIL